jgi:hypothetical protein
MRTAALLSVFALGSAWAQIQLKQQAPASTVAAKPTTTPSLPGTAAVPLQTMAQVEKDLNNRISATGGADRCVLLGPSRGVYVSGFGAVFSSEVDLVNSTDLGPFKTTITPQEKDATHKRKVARVPVLEQSMRDMVKASAVALKDLPETDQIVLAVRLMYRPWEDTSGLPGQIVMRMDRKGGDIRMELQ